VDNSAGGRNPVKIDAAQRRAGDKPLPPRQRETYLNHRRYSLMKVGTSAIAFAISAILMGAASSNARAQTTTTDVTTAPGKIGESETVKMTATVVSIDLGSRDLLLIDSKGKMHKVNVIDQARNLDQV
jgi:hypothetical protein